MEKKDYLIARELKRKLSEVVKVVSLIVFGSRARGDHDEYSDMDVSIEVESVDKGLKEKIADIAWEVGFENFMVISPLVFTTDEIENSPLRSSPILKSITEG
ncbi:MAG: nucleotidyltransferase domain-containing protein, partial [Proteobacteria bacterium]|nr:nucleotidyltransferase domain-containing protein [Pseudomonadota bacterium]